MVSMLILTVFLLFSGSSSQDYDTSIECPFPEGQDVSSQDACARYSACVWSGTACHMRSNDEAGYIVTTIQDTPTGSMMTMEKIDPALTLFDNDVRQLTFEVINHEDYHVQVKIYDSTIARYEVPVPLNLPGAPSGNPQYVVTSSLVGEAFQFAVERLGGTVGEELFNTIGALIFEDQFIQLTTTLPSPYLYGFGENTHSTFKHTFSPRQTQPIFARDHGVEEGILNVYGHHPYFVNVNPNTGDANSVLLFNSNAMEYSTFLLDDGRPALTLRTIGGIIDLHFFTGPSLEDVNRQYANMIGFPVFPQYWNLGFQLCRWGYTSPDHVREVRERMKAMAIPQDGQTLDIDYMYLRRDFTVDPVNWADLPALVQELHNDGLKVTLIKDPALEVAWSEYPPAQRGKDADVYIKWQNPAYIPVDQDPSWNDYMVGKVWPDGPTVFPDFLNPAAHAWWAGELELFHQEVDYDAIWIDMNEPANFDTNIKDSKDGSPKANLKCPYNHLDSPPYPTIAIRIGGSASGRISEHSICMSGNQTDGTNNYLHYDVHSLYGWSESVATYTALQQVFPGKRPVIMSRSTFVGAGKYTTHWLGDNAALWSHLKMSIVGMLEFNLFGIPMIGADICGFNSEPDMEMCARWMELGAFYPFSRNHNAQGNADQDPGIWPEVGTISRDVLMLRYQYIPYLYALFHNANMRGESVVRPVFSQFPTDVTALDVDDQFFWGTGIMVAPVLTQGAVQRDVYFPAGEWYDLRTGAKVTSGPTTLTVQAPLEVIPVYAYGGNIIPYQEPALNTQQSRLNPFGLTIALDSSSQASGEIFWDDGEGEHTMEETYLASLTFASNTLTLELLHSAAPVAGLNLETLQFFGYPSNPTGIEVNGGALPSTDWTFDAATNVLVVTMSAPLEASITVVLT